MALPFQMCVRWETFRLMVNAVFDGRPGKARVSMGKFLVMQAAGGRLLRESTWTHSIKEGDCLQMFMVLDDLRVFGDSCPFPSCRASLQDVPITNGGRTCPQCQRWVILSIERVHDNLNMGLIDKNLNLSIENKPDGFTKADIGDGGTGDSQDSSESVEVLEEDIELYRHINVTKSDTPVIGTPDLVDNEIVVPGSNDRNPYSGTSTRVIFTNATFHPITVGQPFKIWWNSAVEPVTINLIKGPATSLQLATKITSMRVSSITEVHTNIF